MAWTIGTRHLNVVSLFAPASQTVTLNGTGVDTKGIVSNGHEFRVHVNIGVVTGTTPTLVCKIQDSPDNSVWTDVPNAATASLTASGVADFYFRSLNRYFRAVLTLGGTTPNFTVTVDLYAFNRVV